MAPRLRPKPNTHARMQRVATQFNELEVTPNRPGEKSHHPTSTEDNTSRPSQMKGADGFSSGREARVTLLDNNEQPAKSFSWSDAGSTTNNTRRSSPADLVEVSTDDFWDFEESLAPFSSPNSERNKLPDTMPLTSATQTNQSIQNVDFSETASTVHRSSSFALNDGPRNIWNFEDSPPNSSSSRDISKDIPISSPEHLPADELYDSTPRKSVVPTQTAAKLNSKESAASRDIQAGSAKTVLQSKGKKNRQRAKEPIKFDPLTQEIVTVSATRKKKVAAARLPIVSALQESAKASSSPVAGSQKPKPKRSRAQKKAKPEIRPAADNPPPSNPPPSRGKDLAVFFDSPAQPVVEIPSECLQDLPSAGHDDDMETNLPVSGGDVFDTIQAPKQQHYPPPPAIEDLDDGLDYKTETLPTQRVKSKKRKLSRQFSVSEKGSPVMVHAAATKKIDCVLPEPDPIQPCSLEQLPAVQSSSFLRNASNDNRIEQKHGGAFQNIEGKSSSQWLRRVSDKQPAPKRLSSMGKKLHDEIMRGFLGHTDMAQEPSGSKPSCATAPNHVENQMRQTVDQLIARLDDKKTAVFNVANVYRRSGQDSVAHVKNKCLQDGSSLVDTFRNDSGLFGNKLRAARTTIEDRSSAAKTAADLDQLMESRRQNYGRARQSLRAMRDELTREEGIVL